MDKPQWLKIRYNPASAKMKELLAKYKLVTVCQGALCPNCQECWSAGTATFLVLGNECTRNCRFCAIKTNPKPKIPDPTEPARLAAAVSELGLRYVVLTSVDRDDLPDFGAGHFANCIKAIKKNNPRVLVEALVPDFNNDKKAIRGLVRSGVDVLGHNIETTERLTPKVRDARASYRKSLEVLRSFKVQDTMRLSGASFPDASHPRTGHRTLKTKSSLMLGLGETRDEIIATMRDLRAAEVDILTMGQYLRPTKKQIPIERYVEPGEFDDYARIANGLGFCSVVSGPLVRSSYHAAKACVLGK